MHELPVISKKYFPDGVGGANVTHSYWYEPQEKELLDERGGVGLLVSLMGPDDFSGERAAKFMWDSYQEEYYAASGSVKDSMRLAVKSAQQRLMDLIKNEEGVSEQGVDLHMCAFALQGGEIYISMIGNPNVALQRGEETVSISEMLPSYTGSGYQEEVTVGNFGLEKGDILFLSTPKLLESFFEVVKGQNDTKLSNWTDCTKELELFSENMAGNQFLWIVGYDVDETLSGDDEAEEDTAKAAIVGSAATVKMGSRGDDGEKGEEDAKGEGGEIAEEEQEEEGKGDTPHTPRGIYGAVVGGASRKWKEHVKPRIDKVDPKGLYERGKNTLSDKQFLATIQRKFGSLVTKMKMRGSPRQQMRVGEQNTGFLKKFGIPIAVILFVAILGYYWWSGRQEQARNEEIASSLDHVETLVSEATSAWEVEKSRSNTETKLTEATEELDALAEGVLNEEQQEALEDLRDDVQGVYDQMNRVSPLSEDLGTIEIVTDLYLKIGEDVDVVDFEKYGKSLYFVDNASHTIYRYTPGDDVVEEIANSADVLKSPRNIAIGEGIMFVYDEEVGVVTLDMNANEPDWSFRVRPELSARTIGAVSEIASFADNVYILKKDEARVLKSYPAGSGYSYAEEYFRNGSFDKAVDILIDGNIYVLSNASEKIYKYFGGQQDTFSLSGFEVPLGSLCCGTTNLNDGSKLYVFDVDNKRIVAIEKASPDRHPGVGVMVRQYEYRGERDDMFDDVREIVVDVDERMLYVLDGTRVLQVLLENE